MPSESTKMNIRAMNIISSACCHNSCSHDNTPIQSTTLSAHVGNVLSQLMISVCNVQTQFHQLLTTHELNSERCMVTV